MRKAVYKTIVKNVITNNIANARNDARRMQSKTLWRRIVVGSIKIRSPKPYDILSTQYVPDEELICRISLRFQNEKEMPRCT